MDSDFIPAICPNCGGKLLVDPGLDTLTCQYCGIEHLIRRKVSGDVTLEAFAKCPLCRRNDQSEKVSAILLKQTKQSGGYFPQQQVYSDGQGHTYARTVNVPVQSIQISELARRLSPPPPPEMAFKEKSIVWFLIFAIILVIISCCISLFAFSVSAGESENTWKPIINAFIGGSIPMLLSIVFFTLWIIVGIKEKERKQREYIAFATAYNQWQQAQARWKKLYYCGRDDIIYIPDEKTSAAVANMIGYIYTNPEINN